MADTQEIFVIGMLHSSQFHKAKHVAELLHQQRKEQFLPPKSEAKMEFQWSLYKERLRKEEGQQIGWSCEENVAVFVGGQLLPSLETFLQWAADSCDGLQDAIQTIDYSIVAEQAYADHISANKSGYAFMEVCIEGEPVGRLLFELFNDLCPKACANFISLCTGERGVTDEGTKLSYENSIFHRVVPSGWIQGGDICGGSGAGGMSIFGKYFEDECFAVPHTGRGVLGMANEGPNTNNSQFYITLQATPWMDRRYVAFGQVVEGTEVLERIEQLETYNERPRERCHISKCGLETVIKQ